MPSGVGPSRAVEGAVEPRTFLAVVERFVDCTDESRPSDESIAKFIAEYLTDRGVDHDARDLPGALGGFGSWLGCDQLLMCAGWDGARREKARYAGPDRL
jgi:hypothetical protein